MAGIASGSPFFAAILRDARLRRAPPDEGVFRREIVNLHGEGAAKPRVSNHEAPKAQQPICDRPALAGRVGASRRGGSPSNALLREARKSIPPFMTTQLFVLAAPRARVSKEKFAALELVEGAGKAGCLAGTHGPPANKKQAAVTTGGPNNRPSLREWLYGLYVVSPGTGFLAPVASQIVVRKAWHQHRDARTARFRRAQQIVRPRDIGHAAIPCAHRIPSHVP